MKVYHGSFAEIKSPNLKHSRSDIDFGSGFYLTEDKRMAEKWASNRETSILNEYDLDLRGLNVITLNLSEEWIDFVASNRKFSEIIFDVTDIDVIIGPTADDKMFLTMSSYFEGAITKKQAIQYLNIAGYSNQITLKTEKALNNLIFVKSKEIKGLEKDNLRKEVAFERQMASKALMDLLKKDKTKLVTDIRKLKSTVNQNQTDYNEREDNDYDNR